MQESDSTQNPNWPQNTTGPIRPNGQQCSISNWLNHLCKIGQASNWQPHRPVPIYLLSVIWIGRFSSFTPQRPSYSFPTLNLTHAKKRCQHMPPSFGVKYLFISKLFLNPWLLSETEHTSNPRFSQTAALKYHICPLQSKTINTDRNLLPLAGSSSSQTP
jgi:hypothetical protein